MASSLKVAIWLADDTRSQEVIGRSLPSASQLPGSLSVVFDLSLRLDTLSSYE